MNPSSLKKTFLQLEQIIYRLESSDAALIDFDLSLEKTRLLYEQLSELKLEKLSSNTPFFENEFDKIIPQEKEPNENTQFSDTIDQETEHLLNEKDSIEFVEEEKPTVVEEKPTVVEETETKPKIEEKPTPKVKETAEETAKELNILEKEENVSPKEENKSQNLFSNIEKDTVADKFEQTTSLNDILAKIKSDDDLATQLQNRPIEDLKNAISLNDKIWFTRELFDGDNNNYLSVIENINQAESIEKAIKTVENLAWDMQETSTKRFLELIYRRFV